MTNINILYIDDHIDNYISNLLDEVYGNNYSEYVFKKDNTYFDLLNSSEIANANIIIIDWRLFDDESVQNQKFNGEEFKIILKKLFPYIEVVIITQNEVPAVDLMLRKYQYSFNKPPLEYYKDELLPQIEKAQKYIERNRLILKEMAEKNNIDKLLIARISNSLDGYNEYDQLTTEDIDKLINAFEELKSTLDE